MTVAVDVEHGLAEAGCSHFEAVEEGVPAAAGAGLGEDDGTPHLRCVLLQLILHPRGVVLHERGAVRTTHEMDAQEEDALVQEGEVLLPRVLA